MRSIHKLKSIIWSSLVLAYSWGLDYYSYLLAALVCFLCFVFSCVILPCFANAKPLSTVPSRFVTSSYGIRSSEMRSYVLRWFILVWWQFSKWFCAKTFLFYLEPDEFSSEKKLNRLNRINKWEYTWREQM